MKAARCIIVGGGHAAAQLCMSLRGNGWTGPITLIGDETTVPYHRPPLSKTALAATADGSPQLIRPDAFYQEKEIELLLGRRVDAIDPDAGTVMVAGESFAYDKLVLCTGSMHRRPPIPGIDGERVLGVRTLADASCLRRLLVGARRVTVVGGGFIGLEVAASLRARGLEVVLLELAERVLARVASPVVSEFFAGLHRARGVDLRTGVRVVGFEETADGVRTRTADGGVIDGDLVVVGTGALANSELARAAGLAVADGIIVDACNQTSHPDVYAIGDCCEQLQPRYGRRLRLESVQNAVDQAKVAAAALTDKPVPPPATPWFWSDQYELKYQLAGLAEGSTASVVRGEPGSAPFSVWHYRGDELLAVEAVGDVQAYALGLRLLRAGQPLAPELVADTGLSPKALLTQAREAANA